MTNEKQGVPQKTLEIQVGGESYALEIQIGEGGGQRSLEIQVGGESYALEIQIGERGGVKEVWKSRWEGASKNFAIRAGVWIFSGITQFGFLPSHSGLAGF